MKASGFLHCALRSPDPVRIGKFYADLFETGFFIHPVLTGLGIVIVKIASPESVFRGILEFWPLDIQWDGATASVRRIPVGLPPMQNHVAFRVDLAKEEIFERLTLRGIAARYEPRGPGLVIVGFDDPDGNFVELFPNMETMELPPQAFCDGKSWIASWRNVGRCWTNGRRSTSGANLFIRWRRHLSRIISERLHGHCSAGVPTGEGLSTVGRRSLQSRV